MKNQRTGLDKLFVLGISHGSGAVTILRKDFTLFSFSGVPFFNFPFAQRLGTETDQTGTCPRRLLSSYTKETAGE